MKKLILFTFCTLLQHCFMLGGNYYAPPGGQTFTYSASGLKGDLYTPKGSGPFPAVVLIHGGSWAGGHRSHMAWIANELVESGFVVFNIDYHLAPKEHFPVQLNDCKDAVRWMRKNATSLKINPQTIIAYGYSAGAHLASLLGTYQTDAESKVQAVIAGSGPHDFRLATENKAIEKFLGITYKDHPKEFLDASPMEHVSPDDPPFFIYHGTWDELVDPRHSLHMHEALDKVGVKNELLWVEQYGHIDLFLVKNSAVRKAIEFIKTLLSENRFN